MQHSVCCAATVPKHAPTHVQTRMHANMCVSPPPPAGASGFVIEPAVADRYRLPAFGDLSIAGIAGKVGVGGDAPGGAAHHSMHRPFVPSCSCCAGWVLHTPGEWCSCGCDGSMASVGSCGEMLCMANMHTALAASDRLRTPSPPCARTRACTHTCTHAHTRSHAQVPTRFRRASQLRLGPLVLSDPVLLEMSLAKIVGGFHEDVIGIVGECLCVLGGGVFL